MYPTVDSGLRQFHRRVFFGNLLSVCIVATNVLVLWVSLARMLSDDLPYFHQLLVLPMCGCYLVAGLALGFSQPYNRGRNYCLLMLSPLLTDYVIFAAAMVRWSEQGAFPLGDLTPIVPILACQLAVGIMFQRQEKLNRAVKC